MRSKSEQIRHQESIKKFSQIAADESVGELKELFIKQVERAEAKLKELKGKKTGKKRKASK